jgi:hypothetical protein
MVSQDPLTRRILLEQVTRRDGGVTGFVRIPSGQGIELKTLDLAPLSPVETAKTAPAAESRALPASPIAATAAKEPTPSASARREKAAAEQLKVLERQGRRQKQALPENLY